MLMIRHRPHEGDRGDYESIVDSGAPSAARVQRGVQDFCVGADSGSSGEWNAFAMMLGLLPANAKSKLFVVPGNHDLNYVSNSSGANRADTGSYDGRHARSILAMRAICTIRRDRCQIAEVGTRNEVTFIRLDRKISHAIHSHQSPTPNLEFDIDNMFPYVWTMTCGDGTKAAFVGINTIGVGLTLFDNALGRFHAGKILRTVVELERRDVYKHCQLVRRGCRPTLPISWQLDMLTS